MKRIVLVSLLVAASCAPSKKPVETAPAAAVGKSCVSLPQVRESKVIDDSTIDFIMRDGRVMRNSLPFKCSSLGFEKAFTYSTSLSQLCSTDIIHVISQSAGPRLGSACGLGNFVLYTPPTATN